MPAQLAERRVIRFEVLGTPAPKGSMRAIARGGFAQLVPGGSDVGREKMRSWEGAVREQALLSCGDGGPVFVDVSLAVTIVFHVQQPKSSRKRARPRTKPDIDKLARCTLDAMHGSIFDDDSRICDLTLSKRWAAPGHEGATITITEAT